MWRKLIGKKRSKWGNQKIAHEGERFDSKKEYARWLFLKEAEERGDITDLRRQVRFELLPAIKEEYVVHLKTKDVTKTKVVQQAVYYRCDFVYKKNGVEIVEDVKGGPTTLEKTYTIKKKMMKSLKGIDIKEVFKSDDEI